MAIDQKTCQLESLLQSIINYKHIHFWKVGTWIIYRDHYRVNFSEYCTCTNNTNVIQVIIDCYCWGSRPWRLWDLLPLLSLGQVWNNSLAAPYLWYLFTNCHCLFQCSAFDVRISTKTSMQAYKVMQQRVTCVALNLLEFNTLAPATQAALLRHNSDLIVSLRGAVFFEEKKQGMDQVNIFSSTLTQATLQF